MATSSVKAAKDTATTIGEQPEAVTALFRKQLAIQSLRGYGVMGVVIHHMTGLLSSAAAAFDMFFLISGYLITLRLIALAQTGSLKLYFGKFYEFRIRRIIPAAVITLGLTTLVAWLIYVPTRAVTVTHDALWALFFLENYHLAQTSTDYFAQGFAASPVMHFWSLSVEEQFYLFWPPIVLLGLWLGLRGRLPGTGVKLIAVLVIAISFPYGWLLTQSEPLAAHFTMAGRAWEFAIGAMLADFALRYTRTKSAPAGSELATPGRFDHVHDRAIRHVGTIEWVGFLAFFAALFLTPAAGYPVPFAAFGVFAVVLMVYANTMRPSRNPLVTNKAAVWLGDVSYSLYLVHFPVVIFASSYLGASKPFFFLFSLLTSFALTILMFHFVEEPGRRGITRTRQWFRDGLHKPQLARAGALLAAAVVVFAVAPHGTAGSLHGEESPATHEAESTSPSAAPVAPFGRFTTASVAEAITLTKWPTIGNAERIGNGSFTKACEASSVDNPPCVARPASGTDPDKVVLAFGDSTILAYWPMLRDALTPLGWTVVVFGRGGCPASPVVASYGGRDISGCTTHHNSYAAALNTWKPSLILLSEGENVPSTVTGRDGQALTEAQSLTRYRSALTSVVTRFSRSGARVGVLTPPPGALDLGTCKVSGSSPEDCLSRVQPTWTSQSRIQRKVSAATGATYVDFLSFFCHDSICPSVVDDLAVRADGYHVTPEYAALVAPSFGKLLQRDGLIR